MKKTWVENFESAKTANQIATTWNAQIKSGTRKSPVRSYYVVGEASQEDKDLPINKDCPNLMAVFFVDPSTSEKPSLTQILEENICWTATKEDIINNQIPDLVQVYFQQKQEYENTNFPNCPHKEIKNIIYNELLKMLEAEKVD